MVTVLPGGRSGAGRGRSPSRGITSSRAVRRQGRLHGAEVSLDISRGPQKGEGGDQLQEGEEGISTHRNPLPRLILIDEDLVDTKCVLSTVTSSRIIEQRVDAFRDTAPDVSYHTTPALIVALVMSWTRDSRA